MKWLIRERVKVDCVACPWLIKKILHREFIVYEALDAECKGRIASKSS